MIETAQIKKLTSFAEGSALRLREIWKPVWNFLTFSLADNLIMPQKNISIAIEKGSLSAAYGSRFLSHITIKGVREYFFEKGKFPQPKDLVSSLEISINEFRAKNTDITLSIPKAWTIIKTAEFPSTVKENIQDVVSYELDRLTPLMPEEAFFDFNVLNDDSKRLSLIIMAVKADTIMPYINALNEIGLKINRIIVSLSGLTALCHYMDKKADTVFIEIDEKEYEGALSINGSVTHVISGDLISVDEKTKSDIVTKEIKTLTDIAKNQGITPQIAALFKDKNPILQESLKSKITSPFIIIGETDLGIKFPTIPKDMHYSAVGSVIQSLQTKGKGLNLLNKGRTEKQKTPFVLTIILMLAIMVMSFVYLSAPLKIEEKRLKEISRQIALNKDEVRKIEVMNKEADALVSEIAGINNFKENNPLALNILKELTSILPKKTWLTRVRITRAQNVFGVVIEGYTDSATGLLPKLEASKYFTKVEFATPTFRDTKMNSDRFTIRMEIEGFANNTGNIKP